MSQFNYEQSCKGDMFRLVHDLCEQDFRFRGSGSHWQDRVQLGRSSVYGSFVISAIRLRPEGGELAEVGGFTLCLTTDAGEESIVLCRDSDYSLDNDPLAKLFLQLAPKICAAALEQEPCQAAEPEYSI